MEASHERISIFCTGNLNGSTNHVHVTNWKEYIYPRIKFLHQKEEVLALGLGLWFLRWDFLKPHAVYPFLEDRKKVVIKAKGVSSDTLIEYYYYYYF